MSKQFLTKTQASEKLKWGTKGNEFMTKKELIPWGGNIDRLIGYEDNDYPIDDDIEAFDAPHYEFRKFKVDIDFYLEFRGYGDVIEKDNIPKSEYLGEIGQIVTIEQTHI